MKVEALPLRFIAATTALPLRAALASAEAFPIATRIALDALPPIPQKENFILDEDGEPLTDENDEPLVYG